MTPATVEIQWERGTDACLHLTCVCGEESHYDVPEITALTCRTCGRVYPLPREIDVSEDARLASHKSQTPGATTARE